MRFGERCGLYRNIPSWGGGQRLVKHNELAADGAFYGRRHHGLKHHAQRRNVIVAEPLAKAKQRGREARREGFKDWFDACRGEAIEQAGITDGDDHTGGDLV